MRICMILHDPQEIGGLEELTTTLAIELHQRGHQVSVVSTKWVSSDNQYLRRLLENDVKVVQAPKWLSMPASHGFTKQKIVDVLLWLALPLRVILAGGLLVFRKVSWGQSLSSTRGWLRRQFFGFIAPDRYMSLTLLILNWWRICWRPDLLHIQGYTTNLLFVIEWAHKKNIPIVYEEHQTPTSQFSWWQDFSQSINKADIVVAVSEKSAEGLRSVCGVTQPIVVCNPLLPDPFASGWKKNKKQEEVNASITVTTVARLYVTKGLQYLLSAIPLVQRKYPDVKFRVYGDGPIRQELLNYAQQLGLDGETIFVGSFTTREELNQIMAQTDIFVLSSILEGQPVTLVEAMAYGCPIVSTSVGGIPELIEDGVNGLLCEPADPNCLARKICALIDDHNLRDRLGSEARRSYELGPFQPAAVCEHFISIYTELLEKVKWGHHQSRVKPI
jgi:glycosyltransferase involved in cell wall biosynthesis